MRIRTIAFAVAAALVVATAGLAAPTVKDPSKLILQRKDFPAHSDYEAGDELDYSHAIRNIDARTTGYYAGTYSEKQGHLQLHGAVITTGSVKTAQQAFRLAEEHLQATWKTTSSVYKPAKPAEMPRYGSQQAVFSMNATNMNTTGSVALFVRKRDVVWVLWALLDRDQPPKMSEIVGDLKTYAARQKTRVGAG